MAHSSGVIFRTPGLFSKSVFVSEKKKEAKAAVHVYLKSIEDNTAPSSGWRTSIINMA